MMFKQFIAVAACALSVSAHMQLYYPAPFRAYNNPHTVGAPDKELLYPHNCCGKTTPMPCRGYLKLLGTPEGASVANWAAGSTQKWSMVGPAPLGGNHYGGSCQIGFSTDQGKTFRTAVSYEGACPHRSGGMQPSGQEFPFTVPTDLPNGDVVFAWTWVNREQEFFMNCAVVTISGGSGSAASVAASSGTSPSSVLTKGKSAAVDPASSGDGTLEIPYKAEVGITVPPSTSIAAVMADPQAQTSEEVESDDSVTDAEPSSGSGIDSGSGRKCRNQSQRPCRNQKRHHPLLDATMKFKRAPGQKSQRFVQRAATTPFSSRPLMLFANVNNGCTTPKTNAELKYPSPGPDVVEGDGEYPLQLPSGTCK